MSNLSELLPAGGGGKNVNFVASGTLPNGKPVILNSDGTATVVSATALADAKYGPFQATSNMEQNITVVSLTGDKVVAIYRDINNSNYMYAKVGTVTGTSLSYGSAVAHTSSAQHPVGSIYDPSTGKVVVVFQTGSQFWVTWLTVSGTTVTWQSAGSAVRYDTSDPQTDVTLSYDPTHSVILIGYADSNDRLAIRTYNSATGTLGTKFAPVGTSTSGVRLINLAYDMNTGKHIFCYDPNSTSAINYVIVSVSANSGGNLTGTSTVQLNTGTLASIEHSLFSMIQDENTGWMVAFFSGANYYATVKGYLFSATTVTAISTATIIHSSASLNYNVAYYPPSRKVFGVFSLDGGTKNFLGSSLSGFAANTTVTFTTPFIVDNNANNRNSMGNGHFLTYAPTPQRLVLATADFTNSSVVQGDLYVIRPAYQSTNLTSTNFLGITDAAITSGASGSVTIKGGLKSELSSLTPNSIYYAQANGTVSTVTTAPAVRIGKALSSTTLNLEFNS